MKFQLLLFLLVCSGFSGLLAQDDSSSPLDTFSREPIPILIEPMRYPEGMHPDLVNKIEQTAYTLLEEHWHFQVVNHSEEENTGEIDPEYIFQLSLEPLIDDLAQSDIVDSNKQVIGRKYYLTGGISANLRVTDIVSGELKYVRDIKVTQSTVGHKYTNKQTLHFNTGKSTARQRPYPSSPQREALILQDEKNRLLESALSLWHSAWKKETNLLFPCPIRLLKVLDGSAKKPKVIQIDAGQDFGLKKNVYLTLVTIKVYEAMGEQFVRYEKLGYFYPKEIEAKHSTGNIFGGRKAVGEALAAGKQVFLHLQK